MKSITFVSLLLLFSLSFEEGLPLSIFVSAFLPKINKLLKPMTFSTKLGIGTLVGTLNFRQITLNHITSSLEPNDVIHLKINNYKADAKADVKTSIVQGFSINARGEVSVSADLKLKAENKIVGGKTVFTARVTYLKTNTNLKLFIGDSNTNLFQILPESVKKTVEEQILDKMLQKELQKVIDKALVNLI